MTEIGKHSSSLHLATAFIALLVVSACLPGFLAREETAGAGELLPTAAPLPTMPEQESIPSLPAAAPSPLATISDCCPAKVAETPPGFVQEGNFPEVNDLWSSPDGQVFASFFSGVFALKEGDWVQLWSGDARRILGLDSRGWLWVTSGEDGGHIAAVSREGIGFLGPEEGWQPLPEHDYLSGPMVDGILAEPNGRVWLPTGMDELRLYDPASSRWTTYTARDLGFPDLEDEGYQGYFLNDAVMAGPGNPWVGACIGMGESLQGAGAAMLSGGQWQPVAEAVQAKACVYDMETGPRGEVYIGAHKRLLTYDPSDGAWAEEAWPADAEGRPTLAVRIDLDPTGRPVVEVMHYTAASPLGGIDYYVLDPHAGWLKILQQDGSLFYDLAFATDGTGYLALGPDLYRWQGKNLEIISHTGASTTHLAADTAGRLYAIFPGSMYHGLWKWTGEVE